MMIYPAAHFTMGGLWVDYNLMTTIPGLFALGEANFSDHGANRLGANALLQCLVDGYFVIPTTLAGYLADNGAADVGPEDPDFNVSKQQAQEKIDKIVGIKGTRTVDDIHRQLGKTLEDHVGLSRSEAGLQTAIDEVRGIKNSFWTDLKVPATTNSYCFDLQKALRLEDYLELGELMAIDALERKESCGAHLREESRSEEGEAIRDDKNYCHVSAWEHIGDGEGPKLHKEPLVFENVTPSQRSYK